MNVFNKSCLIEVSQSASNVNFAGCIVKNNYHENRFFVLSNMLKKSNLFLDTGQTILMFAGK